MSTAYGEPACGGHCGAPAHIALLGYCYMEPGVLRIVAGQTLWITSILRVNMRTREGKYAHA